jgi:CRISPR-associated protein Cas2
MMVLVTYDMGTESEGGKHRLRKIAKLCQNHGQRVQFSVFECLLDPAMWVVFRAKLLAIIDPATDSLRFYFLEHTGRGAWSTLARSPDTTQKAPSFFSANVKFTAHAQEVRACAFSLISHNLHVDTHFHEVLCSCFLVEVRAFPRLGCRNQSCYSRAVAPRTGRVD